MQEPFNIGLLIFPDLTPLDFVGPYEVFSRMKNSKVHIIAETKDPVPSERGLFILPDRSLDENIDLDLVLIPGGLGVNRLMENEKVLNWLREKSKTSKYISSVCTGSLVLAAAGLLNGYKATTHWLSLDVLKLFPKIDVKEDRVMIDRDRITGGGVTAGIDFALRVVAEIQGQKAAEEIQLMIEYNPEPPFLSGHPKTANPDIVSETRSSKKKAQDLRKEIAVRSIERLSKT
ncbi:thiamine biosynthesis protein ThiJ [Leptospira hartskeerlii]|uniref:Thiamine biosynthesis protein ThiJ n=1 Tax=Leptospira hartskeerlii TaxID=2023177 RepID=A0A2M9XGK2_9LEPT|nr:DJ-1/PfpI family protein [Leptospira hartskeerlii]PJZ26803.1 thiamine biosynthesis protein ThiJ [Leptospira hartskeerlii]PJZ34715.1 thiamine biosynthesis protein ThiJ [Leptospira hartskeerlii]